MITHDCPLDESDVVMARQINEGFVCVGVIKLNHVDCGIYAYQPHLWCKPFEHCCFRDIDIMGAKHVT